LIKYVIKSKRGGRGALSTDAISASVTVRNLNLHRSELFESSRLRSDSEAVLTARHDRRAALTNP
jgi:hypothetical protein